MMIPQGNAVEIPSVNQNPPTGENLFPLMTRKSSCEFFSIEFAKNAKSTKPFVLPLATDSQSFQNPILTTDDWENYCQGKSRTGP